MHQFAQAQLLEPRKLRAVLLLAPLVLEPREPMRQAAVQRQNVPSSPQLGAQQTGSSRFDWFHNTP
jgi:hypothetical protein